jgi:peptide methionine sulfoxide reductase MsrA
VNQDSGGDRDYPTRAGLRSYRPCRAVRFEFDPTKLSYERIWTSSCRHDPTTDARQGADVAAVPFDVLYSTRRQGRRNGRSRGSTVGIHSIGWSRNPGTEGILAREDYPQDYYEPSLRRLLPCRHRPDAAKKRPPVDAWSRELYASKEVPRTSHRRLESFSRRAASLRGGRAGCPRRTDGTPAASTRRGPPGRMSPTRSGW